MGLGHDRKNRCDTRSFRLRDDHGASRIYRNPIAESRCAATVFGPGRPLTFVKSLRTMFMNPLQKPLKFDKCQTSLIVSTCRKEPAVATFEYSDGFDAVAFHLSRMSRPDYDPYYDEEEQS